MAVTSLRPRKARKGKSIYICLQERIDYALDELKTGKKQFISSYQCSPETAAKEFCVTKQIYEATTGRTRKKDSDVISYAIIQSFAPDDNISAEEANRLGYKLAKEFTNGEHQFIVGTHINREHVHNHIEINSTALDCTHKFLNYWNSSKVIQEISDRLCRENGLSVIENPKGKGQKYKEWEERKNGNSWKARLQATIDEVVPQSNSFDEFLTKMEQAGYQRKKGKRLAFYTAEQKKSTRTDRIGHDYSEEMLRNRIEGKTPHIEKQTGIKINFLIDIPERMKKAKGQGYERWAKVHNLKEMAKTLNFLTGEKLKDYSELEKKIEEVSLEFDGTSSIMKRLEHEMAEKAALKMNIVNYVKTKNIYAEYKKSRFKEKFRETHEADILLHEAAKRAFDALKVKKLPTVASLQAEYSALLSEKQEVYKQYKVLSRQLQQLRTAKQNVDALLNLPEKKNSNTKQSEMEL